MTATGLAGRSRVLRSLGQREFRLYVAAQGTSALGGWVHVVAEGTLVYRLTGSGVALGVATALQFVPLLVLGSHGGVIADRVNRRRLLIATQWTAATIAAVLALVAATGVVEVWMVLVASGLFGLVYAVDLPASQAFTNDIVPGEQIANATGLLNALNTSARVVGPALAAILIGTAGLATCFAVNAASFACVALALVHIGPVAVTPGNVWTRSRVTINARGEAHADGSVLDVAEPQVGDPPPSDRTAPVEASRGTGDRGVIDGLRYVAKSRELRTVLVVLAITGVFGLNFRVLLPIASSAVTPGTESTYAIAMAVLGLGATAGSIAVAALDTAHIRHVLLTCALFGLTLLGTAQASSGSSPSALYVAAAGMGLAYGSFTPLCSAVLQSHVDEGHRGRVMALYTIAFLGTTPIGGPLIGYVAEVTSSATGFVVGAGGCGAAIALGLTAWKIRPKPAPRRTR